jgi:hypothetical protein
LAVEEAGLVHSIVKDTLGVDQLFTIMSALRAQYNKTTDRKRRARMGRLIDIAADTVVNDYRRYCLQHNEEDSD